MGYHKEAHALERKARWFDTQKTTRGREQAHECRKAAAMLRGELSLADNGLSPLENAKRLARMG